MDSELTGRDMLAIRDHLSSCRNCREDHESLLSVKRILGSLSVQEADVDWTMSLTVTTMHAGRPWWAKMAESMEPNDAAFVSSAVMSFTTSRGKRLARALALSAVVVFAAAAQIESGEHVRSSGAATAGSMGFAFRWSPHDIVRRLAGANEGTSPVSQLDPNRLSFSQAPAPVEAESGSRLLEQSFREQQQWPSPASLTLVVSSSH